ncbi:ABC transporter ATP-binding protein [Clostridium tagluense]|uniref:ABC transporter ATP-binding protein n=1 Tax=Clostridium tagluense TaxID=360422 RepID=UPI001CF48824|nr:ABC transporter ATP-binding protein [Clostridium tagluense]MCB2311458.1 ABC transporter ATP-binding protein [Clostridium tagluense]MCB2316182.1 ABC transporter ATP-binding protein [Clostridium tagluense]MCB2321014.1 ABC transporter ATP-binding protein [Clostridium tagluense]MCB2326031.1 ABC transporter ATP-binding protein [Clostridium tagluense]MCB2330754.1 ABC transporter ATP-binding protein [Clostridium tagluense]
MKDLLEVNNLVVSFLTKAGEVQAVRDVSFSLKKGEVLAILGESGCGKSVLCKSILRVLPENACIKSGEVILNGENLINLEGKSMDKVRGREISMILQDPMTSLNPTMSIGKQIMEAVLIHQKISKSEAKKKSIELMELAKIDHAEKRFHQYPYQLSGGMIQRTVIAIALACKPKVLIADEPTTALDVTTQAQIIELIQELQIKTGISIIFITHDLGVVAKLAQRIAIMYAGKIVEIGTSKDIFYDPRHPYTIGLICSLPNMDSDAENLNCIPGMPPSLLNPPKGDAFAQRNKYALKIDYLAQPPMFKISDTHSAATWLLHKDAPKIKPPIRFKEFRVMQNED